VNKINNNVTNTALAIVFIALAVILVGGLGTTTTGPITLQKAFAQNEFSERCVSTQFEGGGTNSACFFGGDKNVVKENSERNKEDCKDAKKQGEVDKCSSSQTGFGELCNWARFKGDSGALVTGGHPPCNDERHIQKDLLE
jgi:hypothetical protein